jgi:ABC-type hemin transport system ATPase subunit
LVEAGPPNIVLKPELLSAVYETPLEVLRHPLSDRPVIVHAGSDARTGVE